MPCFQFQKASGTLLSSLRKFSHYKLKPLCILSIHPASQDPLLREAVPANELSFDFCLLKGAGSHTPFVAGYLSFCSSSKPVALDNLTASAQGAHTKGAGKPWPSCCEWGSRSSALCPPPPVTTGERQSSASCLYWEQFCPGPLGSG